MDGYSSSGSPQQSRQRTTEVILPCDALLDLIANHTSNNSENDDDPFGHPPPPKIASLLKLSSTTTTTINNQPPQVETTQYYLVISYSSQCVGAQVFCRMGISWDASRPQIVFSGSTETVGVVIRSRDERQSRTILNPKTKKVRKTMEWTQNRVQIVIASSANNNSSQLNAVEMTLGWNGFGVEHVCPIATSVESKVLEIVATDQTVAISYANGTILQIPSSALTYPESKQDEDYDDDTNNPTTTSIIWDANIIKAQVQLPQENVEDEYHILPLLSSTKNVASPCTHISDTIRSTLEACTLESAHTMKDTKQQRISALVYPKEKPEALGSSPSLAVYTTSSLSPLKPPTNHNDDEVDDNTKDDDERDSELLSVAMGATSSLFRGVSSVLGFGTSSSRNELSKSNHDTKKTNIATTDSDTTPPRQLLGPLYQPPTVLLTSSGTEYHDSPRRFLTVSSVGNQIIATDSLGRVLLWDAPTFSVQQIFKGWREAQAVSFAGNLALYSPIRRTLQLWSSGVAATNLAVPHHPQIQFISSSDERCFVLQPMPHKGFVLKEITMPESSSSTPLGGKSLPMSPTDPQTLSSPPSASGNNNNMQKQPHHHHIQLQMLQQILSSQDNPQEKVLEIVSEIQNPHEFLAVIPLVASNSVRGVALLKMVLNHAQQLLNKDEKSELETCLQYHEQLIQAYQHIHDFEVNHSKKHKLFEEEGDDVRQNPKSTWAIEGLTWMATQAQVVAKSSPLSSPNNESLLLSFSQLCQACELHRKTKQACTIVFKDSYRTRRPLLQHLFRPLLHDTFSYVTLTNIIDAMGLEEEDALLESYFSEWYLHCHERKLSTLAKVSLLQLNSNISRWLKSRVAASVDARLEKEHVGADTILLSAVHQFCQNTEQLVEGFLLAATCRDAISSVCQKREVRTYGKVYNQNVLQPWEVLLKKLRLLIFVHLRLYDDQQQFEAPLSLQNVSELNWNRIVAQDELRASTIHDELVALEQQAASSRGAASPDAWRHMQQACTISDEERAEYLVELEPTQTVVWYVPKYYQNSSVLNAHRTILLFQKFQQHPQRLDILQQALSHCRALSPDYALSVRYEMWQTILRPMFQEYLFGEQQDSKSDEQANWIQTVGKAALIVLNLMEQSMNEAKQKGDDANKKSKVDTSDNDDDDDNWPPLEPNRTLEFLSQKLRQVQLHGDAFDFHRILILGCMQSPEYFETLANAVGPDVYSQAFQPNALCGMLSIPIAPVKTQVEAQMEFIQTAISKRALSTTQVLDRIGDVLEDLETLALLWSVDTRDVRTLFVLALYELGQDELISDSIILTSQQAGLDFERLVEDGIVIICQRLTHVLDPRQCPPIRSVLSQLDADLVEWIRAQASESKLQAENIPSLAFTHSFLLQLLRLSTCSETKQSLHSLSVLTGIVLNELGNSV